MDGDQHRHRAGGAVANSIREDPRKKGLLYAATDMQVWVSFDDGDHWRVAAVQHAGDLGARLQVKDDSTCLCADLVAGTHGRGFWILDNVTPLRQAAEARAAAARGARRTCSSRSTAVRVRFGTNDPTPWPPECRPARIRCRAASSTTTWPRCIGAGDARDPGRRRKGGALTTRARTRCSTRIPRSIRRRTTSSASSTPTRAGLRTSALLAGRADRARRSAPACTASRGICAGSSRRRAAAERGGGGAGGAVPHRTYPSVAAPWAAPGAYTVRLTVDGKQYTQPLTLRLDPRVKTPAACARAARVTHA